MTGNMYAPRAAGARVRQLAAFAGALLFLSAGCSRAPEFVEVEGLVTLDGKPLPEVEVSFLPDPEKGNNGPSASAYTDAQGHYKLFCDQAKRDGAVVGPTRVCVIDITAVRLLSSLPGVRMPGELAPPVPQSETDKRKVSRVPADYKSPARTPLRIEVQPGQQKFDIDIPSGKRK
jgi:hypothetical protein